MDADLTTASTGGDPLVDPVVDLRTVTEELRVADEEIVAQQRQIEDLLEREREGRQAMGALVAALPVAVVATSVEGTVLRCNPAAATLLGLDEARLVRKPLLAFVDPADRRRARDMTTDAGRTGQAAGAVVLVSRGGQRVLVDGLVSAAGPPGGQLTWVLQERPASGTAATPDEEQLRAVAALCALPLGAPDVRVVLGRVAGLATRAVPGVAWCSATLGDPATPDSTASDSVEAQHADGAQWSAQAGPCLDAWRTAEPVVSADLQADDRWPVLAEVLAGGPVRSALGVPVLVDGRPEGVLNLYGEHVDALSGPGMLDRALLFTAAAAAVVADARRHDELRATAAGLQEAMRSRAGIEQAKGIVAAWADCGVEEAFEVLSSLSQDRNVKLRDIAAVVVGDRAGRDQVRALVRAQHARLLARRGS